MKDILKNLALMHLINFGKEHNLDLSGTHLVKNGRGFKYSLCKDTTGYNILTVSFYKSSVPTYFLNRPE
jgi:hypothetical protein